VLLDFIYFDIHYSFNAANAADSGIKKNEYKAVAASVSIMSAKSNVMFSSGSKVQRSKVQRLDISGKRADEMLKDWERSQQ
jgi:hypothetical protein